MPASSVGALNGWGLYLIASAALIAALAPQLAGTTQDSREGSDYRIADGIQSILDSLHPGTVVTFSFGGLPSGDQARLEGHEVILTYGKGAFALRTLFDLPNVTLAPDVSYQAWLEGNEVGVRESG